MAQTGRGNIPTDSRAEKKKRGKREREIPWIPYSWIRNEVLHQKEKNKRSAVQCNDRERENNHVHSCKTCTVTDSPSLQKKNLGLVKLDDNNGNNNRDYLKE